jgi:hypothetical protein
LKNLDKRYKKVGRGATSIAAFRVLGSRQPERFFCEQAAIIPSGQDIPAEPIGPYAGVLRAFFCVAS